jgi:hypothetical protein
VRRGWGWAGTAADLAAIGVEALLESLSEHHRQLLGLAPSFEQLRVWRQEADVLRSALSDAASAGADVSGWGVVLEFELPLEGGRRPDAVILANDHVIVVEFKSATKVEQAHLDQVAAYARDLSEYHGATHGRQVSPVLALPNVSTPPFSRDDVLVTDGASLGPVLQDLAGDGPPLGLTEWLDAPYAPLPTLVAAARRIFEHEPLPRIRRAESAHIPETVRLLEELASDAESNAQRKLVLVGGVPGAGKTLAGLSLVYAAGGLEADATFLSGNGPLVKVLQDALGSRVFVRDLHKFIGDYGLKERDPQHHVVVFDEAQRMWDRRFMLEKRDVDASEPDLLIAAGDRLPSWAALVGLIGEGQEIYVGEEGGLGLWAAALARSGHRWTVHGPPGIAFSFPGHQVHEHDLLMLKVPLRSRRAEHLYEWVRLLLRGSPALAARKASHVQSVGFPMWLTRDLEAAKDYARLRYAGEPEARYGLLVSSHADRKHLRRGLDVSFQTMGRLNDRIGRWFNAEPDDPASCCQLEQPVTEFQVQGLEIDLPIVVWGEDLLWSDSAWNYAPKRRRSHVDAPEQLLENVYRVLLTRGRDGLIIVVPNGPEFDPTELTLLASGVRPLPEAEIAVTITAAEDRPASNGH